MYRKSRSERTGHEIRCPAAWAPAALALIAGAQPAWAQDRAAPDAAAEATPATPATEGQNGSTTRPGSDIVVVGKRADQPELVLGREAIASYAASTIGELIQAVSEQTGKKPEILVNGRRIGGIMEIAGLPPEAIERMDILSPADVIKYGFAPGQAVFNIILLKHFKAIVAEPSFRFATEGGRSESGGTASFTTIRDLARINVGIEYNRATSLYESERGLASRAGYGLFDPAGNVGPAGVGEIDPRLSALAGETVDVAGVPDAATRGVTALTDWVATAGMPNAGAVGAFRTLLPETERVALTGSYATRMFGDVAASFSLGFSTNQSESAVGLPRATLTLPATNPFSPFDGDVLLYRALDSRGALRARASQQALQATASFSGNSSGWLWSLAARADGGWSRTRTDRGYDLSGIQASLDAGDPAFNPFAPIDAGRLGAREVDSVRSVTRNASLDFTALHKLLKLPSGPVSLTVRGNIGSHLVDNDVLIASVASRRDTDSFDTDLNAILSVPLATPAADLLPVPGTLSATFSARRNSRSRVGAAMDYAYGLNWLPVDPLALTVQLTHAKGLPPIDQRDAPLLSIPNVPVYDFVRGETVGVTQLTGGNPALAAETRSGFSLDARLRPIPKSTFSIGVNFAQNEVRNGIGSLPAVAADVERAFPERFVRDADGRLLSIDTRPINFARSRQRVLRSSLFFTRKLRSAAAPAKSPIAGAMGLLLGRRPDAGGDPDGADGMLLVSLAHEWRLEDKLLLRDGLPERDLLSGASIAGRAPSAHTLNGKVNYARNGMVLSLTGRWQSGSSARGDANALDFSSLATVDLRAAATVRKDGGLAHAMPWLEGTRLTLEVTNLLDAKTRVRDAFGHTPPGYEAGYLDPLGRAIKISLRKLM